jgi:hypothetical protein
VKGDGTPLPHVRNVHVYTDSAYVRLELNGEIVTPPTAVPAFGNAAFQVAFAPGNLTAVALASPSGPAVGSFSALTPSSAASLRLTLDAPSPKTGTGSALVANGQARRNLT